MFFVLATRWRSWFLFRRWVIDGRAELDLIKVCGLCLKHISKTNLQPHSQCNSLQHRTKSTHVASMIIQITPSQSFEVHPYCANDANKANDKEDPLFSFHVSHETRTTFPFLRTVLDAFWLQRVAQLFENLWSGVVGGLSQERRRLKQVRESERKDCLESETHFKGIPKKQPVKSEMKPVNKAPHGNK